ncbi:hypothetical protein [Streptomyces sp. NPDC014734]|uniref:hypothetical protein n=1 Tax=Streptomyces sp. NPDC014734 TaxID=3364886 RepID=UPI0036F73777
MLRTYGARRIGVLGSSKGAEAALHLSVLLPGVDAVVALSPTSPTWANVGPGHDGRDRPYRSSWTWRGEPLPFVPYDEDWVPAPASAHFRYGGSPAADAALGATAWPYVLDALRGEHACRDDRREPAG